MNPVALHYGYLKKVIFHSCRFYKKMFTEMGLDGWLVNHQWTIRFVKLTNISRSIQMFLIMQPLCTTPTNLIMPNITILYYFV